jgi:hypothetical protein
MNIRNAVLAVAAAVLITPAAFAATMATKEDCASAQKKADAALTANSHASEKAKHARAEAEKLCQEGKTAEGVKKYDESAKEAAAKAK